MLETLQSLQVTAFKKDGIDKRKLSNPTMKEKRRSLTMVEKDRKGKKTKDQDA